MCVFRISMDLTDEKNGSLNKPVEWGKAPTRVTSVAIDFRLHDDAKTNKIALKDALEFGIRFLISDKDGFDYPASNLLEKLHKTVKHRNALIQEVDALRKQIDPIDEAKTDAEIDEVFNNIKGEVKKDEI